MRFAFPAALLALWMTTFAWAEERSGLQIERPWARATVGSGGNGVVYLTISNSLDEPARLVSVSTPIAERASIHESVRDNGMLHMRAVGVLEIAPHTSVALEPGGLHVMLMKLKTPIREGERFPLELRFEKREAIRVEVMASGIAALEPPAEHTASPATGH